VLDRLLELNQQRYAQEVTAALHDKKNPTGRRKKLGADVPTPLSMAEDRLRGDPWTPTPTPTS
jgi:hypothetical protein